MSTTPHADDPDDPWVEPDLMTDRAHSARTYDYLLGGKTNYAADRAAVEQLETLWPDARSAARSNRAFMHRAARHVTSLGIDQFLDIGTGIPTEPNLHQVVQGVAPAARVVYVDKDPIVLAHAAALMTSNPQGMVEFISADARDPVAILTAEGLGATLDLTRPVGLSALAILHFLDDDETQNLVHTLLDAVPSGSTITLSHATADNDSDGTFSAARDVYEARGIPYWPRSRSYFEKLLADVDLVEPGITYTHSWRPIGGRVAPSARRDLSVYAMLALKP